jgi:uncharacterized membrane protein
MTYFFYASPPFVNSTPARSSVCQISLFPSRRPRALSLNERAVESIIVCENWVYGIKSFRAESGREQARRDRRSRIMAHFHIYVGQDVTAAAPVIRRIEVKDIGEALEKGVSDFCAMPSHLAFLALIYPFCGMVLAYATSHQNALQLLFPLASGFALVGPFTAVGLYEMSRRRELGLEISWKYAFNVLRSPSIPSIAALGSLLLAIFAAWITTSQWLYAALFGPIPPAVLVDFLRDVALTERGWLLIGVGCFIGFCFAAVTLAISVVSFPLLLDRDTGAIMAVATSIRAVRENPIPMALWGLIVAAALLIGSLPFFIGLTIVVPVLSHATWHLYRKLIVRDPTQEHPAVGPKEEMGQSTHDRTSPHSFLFPWPKD